MKNIFTNGNDWQKHYNIMFPVNTDGTAKTAFNSDMQKTLFEIEDSSWWFQYRGTVIKNLINKFFDADRFICDIGGGNGFTTKLLQDSGYEVVLLEPSQTACLNGHKRGIKNIICGTLNNEDFKDESIENCCLLDVLEHIENDADFLRLIHKKLVSSGKILITVPAIKILWRNEEDYFINWNDTAINIKRFIDAVGYPYKGATTFANNQKVRILNANVVNDLKIENRDVGKIIFFKNNCPVVVCREGLLQLENIVDDHNKVVQLTKFRIQFK